MYCISNIINSLPLIINSIPEKKKTSSPIFTDMFHVLGAAAGSANLVMTHRDRAKYSRKHLPQQAKEINTVMCLYITGGHAV